MCLISQALLRPAAPTAEFADAMAEDLLGCLAGHRPEVGYLMTICLQPISNNDANQGSARLFRDGVDRDD
jgi:hypothetical protein